MSLYSQQFSTSAFEVNSVIDDAEMILMTLLHCDEEEARGLLHAQSEAAHLDVAAVAAAFVEADTSR